MVRVDLMQVLFAASLFFDFVATISSVSSKPSNSTAFDANSSPVLGSNLSTSAFSTGTSSSAIAFGGSTTAAPTGTLSSDLSPIYTVPATGSGSSYASACLSDWDAYINASISYDVYNITQTQLTIETSYKYTAVVTTLCNNSALPHVVGALTPIETMTSAYWATDYDAENMVSPPACSIQTSDCKALWSAYRSADSASALADSRAETTLSLAASATEFAYGNDFIGTQTITYPLASTLPTLTFNHSTYSATDWMHSPVYVFGDYETLFLNDSVVVATQAESVETAALPTCDFGTARSPELCGKCSINGYSVRLQYFPVTTSASRNDCATRISGSGTPCPFGITTLPGSNAQSNVWGNCYYASTFTAEHNAHSGPYIVANGSTFYENKAYISLQTAYAEDNCGRIGSTYTNHFLEVESSNIYSVCGRKQSATGYSFNFADLTMVPPAAYFCAPRCWDIDVQGLGNQAPVNNQSIWYSATDCGLMVDAWYQPQLMIPPELRNLDPAWAECDLGLIGLFDPPEALSAVTTLAGVLWGPATTAASPAASVPAQATQTATPLPDNVSSSAADPVVSTAVPDPIDPASTKSSPSSPIASTQSDPQRSDSDPGKPATTFADSSPASDPHSATTTAPPQDPAPPITAALPASDPATTSLSSSGRATTSFPSNPTNAAAAIASYIASALGLNRNTTIIPSTTLSDPATGVVFTLGNHQTLTATRLNSESWAIASSTVSKGQTVTLPDGEVIAVKSDGLNIERSSLAASVLRASDPAVQTQGVTFSANSELLTATHLAGGEYGMGSATFTPGSATTLADGQVLSVNDAGTLVLGGATLSVVALSASPSTGLTMTATTDIVDPISSPTNPMSVGSSSAATGETPAVATGGAGHGVALPGRHGVCFSGMTILMLWFM